MVGAVLSGKACWTPDGRSGRGSGDLEGARQVHEQTLAARRRVLGDDHRDTLTSMSSLAQVEQELGKQ
jgi:hypothetical protein